MCSERSVVLPKNHHASRWACSRDFWNICSPMSIRMLSFSVLETELSGFFWRLRSDLFLKRSITLLAISLAEAFFIYFLPLTSSNIRSEERIYATAKWLVEHPTASPIECANAVKDVGLGAKTIRSTISFIKRIARWKTDKPNETPEDCAKNLGKPLRKIINYWSAVTLWMENGGKCWCSRGSRLNVILNRVSIREWMSL